MSKHKTITVDPQTVTTAVINAGAVFNNINLPGDDGKTSPKIETCEVGMFRLPGVKLDLAQFTEFQLKEMEEFTKESGGFIGNDGLFSWKNAGKRDWFLLKYS